MQHLPELPNRLVVGVDFGDASKAAASWSGRWLVRSPEIVLVHVLRAADGAGATARSGHSLYAEWSPERDAVERRLRKLGTGLDAEFVWCEARSGDPADAILAAASEFRADGIVIGAPTGIEDGRGASDSLIVRLLARTPVPVIIGAGPLDRHPRRILVIGNATRPASNALRWARAVGASLDAEVRTHDGIGDRLRDAPVLAGGYAAASWAGEVATHSALDRPSHRSAPGAEPPTRIDGDIVVVDGSVIHEHRQIGDLRGADWPIEWATRCPVVFVPEQADPPRR